MIFLSVGVVVLLLVFWFTRAPQRTGLENGTAVTLTQGNTVLHATLNNTRAANSLAAQLPMTVSFGRSGVDYCATAPRLDSDSSERQFGWHLGDISLVGGWLSIFHGGQNRLPMPIMVLGSVDEKDLQTLKALGSSVTLTIELAE